jgi:hypothetical protein
MRAIIAVSRRVVVSAATISLGAGALAAQLPNASPAAYGMGGNYTAMARGYEAVAWNPANLAMPGRPFLSLGLAALGGTVGMDPVGFGMLGEHSGLVVDSAVRSSWVDLVRVSGRQRVRVDWGVTPLALSLGPIGIQVGASQYVNMDLSPDMFEAVMFGNAGLNNGAPKALDFTGTGMETAAFATGAVSFALPLPLRFTRGLLGPEHFAVAVTGKYVVGSLAIMQDGGSVFGGTSVNYSFPIVIPMEDSSGIAGMGTGADISASWQVGRWRVGALVENVFNSFKWDTTKLQVQSTTGYFDEDTSYSTEATLPYGAAPLALREKIAAQKFMPAINVGMSFKPTDFLTVTADLHQQMGGDDAISIGPKNRMGVGAELRILPFIPLRAGVASVTDGWQAGAGLGVRLLGLEVGVSGSVRKRGAATESGMMISVFGLGH